MDKTLQSCESNLFRDNKTEFIHSFIYLLIVVEYRKLQKNECISIWIWEIWTKHFQANNKNFGSQNTQMLSKMTK